MERNIDSGFRTGPDQQGSSDHKGNHVAGMP
jgi:hypothetical protein